MEKDAIMIPTGKPHVATILVAGNSETLSGETGRFLAENGYHVIPAHSGEDALQQAARHAPDVIVLDVETPGLSGCDVCRELKKDERTAVIPVIHLAADAQDPGTRLKSLESGALACLARADRDLLLIPTITLALRSMPAERRLAEQTLKRQLDWQTAISEISTLFFKTPGLDRSIDAALAAIGRLGGADRVYLFLFSDHDSLMSNTHEWTGPGIAPQKSLFQDLPTHAFPWWMDQLRQGKTIYLPDLADIPDHAENEREFFSQIDFEHLLVAPVHTENKLYGFVGFDTPKDGARWIGEDTILLRMTAELLGLVMEKQAADDALRTSQAHLSNALRIAKLGHWEFDLSRRLFTFTDEFYALFRTTAEQVGGYTMTPERYGELFLHPDDQGILADEVRKTLESTDPDHSRQLEHRILYADGQPGHIAVQFRAITDQQGRIIKTFGANQDITERKRIEDALRERESFIKKVLDNLPIGIAVNSFKPKVEFEYMNDNFCRFYRTTREALANPDDFWTAVYEDPAFRETMKKRVLDGCASGDPDRMVWEAVPISRRGRETTFITAKNIPFQENQSMISTVWDITESKKAEENLILFRNLMDQSNDAIFIIELETARFLDVNENACRVLGYSREELLAMTVLDIEDTIITPDAWKSHLHGFRTQRHMVLESVHKRKDGSVFPVEIGIRIITSSDQEYMVSIARDITARKQAEAEIQEAENKYRTLVENVSDMIFLLDKSGNVRFANALVCRNFQIDEQQAKGVPLCFFWCGDSIQRVDDAIRKVAHTLKPVSVICSCLDLIFDLKISCTVKSGEIFEMVCAARDITDRVRAEEEKKNLHAQLAQAQKMEAVGQLAGGIAHDFNNMLTVIMGNANLVQMNLDPEDKVFRGVSAIVNASERAADLTMKLLTFARRDKLNVKPISVRLILSRLVSMIERGFLKNIRIAVTPCGDMVVEADENQLQQALMNICVNARDAMPGGGTLSIACEPVTIGLDSAENAGARPGRYCAISVSDTGVGIPGNILKKVMDPFFTTKGAGKGTGLGLSVTHGIITSHGGFMDINSEAGRGTCVKIFLPVSDKPATHDRAIDYGIHKHGTETILVVDDEDSVLTLATLALSGAGYTVLAADGGVKAVETYRERRGEIALVVLDLVMPEMDGAQVFAELKALNPGVRVVLSSGYSIDGMAANLIADGASAFVQKPFTVSKLCNTVRDVLDADSSD